MMRSVFGDVNGALIFNFTDHGRHDRRWAQRGNSGTTTTDETTLG